MLNRRKFSLLMLLALIAGFLFAGAFTHITYPCSPFPSDTTCVSFEKAVMHPNDLASNYQGSLTQFLLKFLIGFAIILVLLVAFDRVRTNKHLISKS